MLMDKLCMMLQGRGGGGAVQRKQNSGQRATGEQETPPITHHRDLTVSF